MHVSMLARTGNLVKDMKNDFRNYAVNHLGMSSNTLDSYARHMEKTAGCYGSDIRLYESLHS